MLTIARNASGALLGLIFTACTAGADPEAAPVAPPPSEPAEACPAVDFAAAAALGDLAAPNPQDDCTWKSFFDGFADAHVICSGEGSHGTNEATLVHARMARELVLARGFRTIALEGDDASTALYTAFVDGGDEAALKKAFSNDRGTLAATKQWERFFRELRAIRLELPPAEHLVVRGIDVAIQLGSTLDRLFGYLKIVDPETATAYEGRLPKSVSTKEAAQKGATAAAELQAIIETKETEYTTSEPAGYELATSDVRALAEGYRFLESYVQNDFVTGNATVRDPAMARNLLALAERDKILVLAHEGHCARDTPSQGTPRAAGTFAFGKAVSAALGPRYVVVGHLFSSGKELRPNGEIADVTSPAGSLEAALAKGTEAEIATTLVRTAPFRTLDLSKDWTLTRFEESTSPAAQLDGFVWLRAISPAKFR